ncbi:hypothetical protein DH2020_042004 [Rehmannia glutinosa]|uniref:Reverse transcriptase Ty1/copia-type domain-containing protein n=1 Tax=Rehmannia glutinosa TaxID=99300 RepID=A0ABR0UPJ7_REHGL
MKEEFTALQKNNTWILTYLPHGKNVVGCKWVYKIKKHADGSVAKYKARLVAQGFSQAPGFDFKDTFSPVVKPTTIRVIITLAVTFSWPNLGELHHFLGIEINKTPQGLHLSQGSYVKELLQRAHMCTAKRCPTPMVASLRLSKFTGDPSIDGTSYRSIVGALQYVTITRPEISYSVNKVSQYMVNPLDSHWKAVKRILRYLAGTPDVGLNFTAATHLILTAFSDSDWAADLDDRRSTSGFCVYLGSNLASWSSKNQHTVSKSSTEAEYRSLAQATSEVTWLSSLLHELNFQFTKIPVIWVDNLSTISLASNPVLHARTKHIELDIHFVREKVAAQHIQIQHVPSSIKVATYLLNH